MVTLPTVDSYPLETQESLEKYSPVFSAYLNHLSRPTSSFSDEIRIEKHTAWLECAIATFDDKRHPEEICKFWSIKTNAILEKVWRHCNLLDNKVSLLAYGKLGSEELNLSSDIDIAFVRDNSVEASEIQSQIREFIKILNDVTSFGFAYRVDLNLRPGGDNSPLIPSKSHFYSFYDEYLEAWHRLSFVRVRNVFSDTKLSKDLLSYCKKRCFPRRLDFSIIQEIKNVRNKIEFQWHKANEPLDIKLHPGGIRDIELYIQSLQVIYGGRNPALQSSGMSEAINQLGGTGALEKEESEFFSRFYWRLRKIENLIHIKDDQHTYLLQDKHLTALKNFNVEEKKLSEQFEISQSFIGKFFNERNPKSKPKNNSSAWMNSDSKKAINEIKNLKSISIKKQGIEKLKSNILDEFISKADKIAIDQNLAIQIFRDFIFSIKSKSSIFYLLDRHRDLLENLAWLFSVSPYIGQLITRRPELIDSFVLGRVIIEKETDMETLWESLIDYKMLGQLMGVIELIKNDDSSMYFTHLSEQADLIVESLHTHISKELGAEPLEILTLGKWSGMELGIRSDLDFVFLSEKEPTTSQVKVARRIINILTSRSNAGRLYDIDLRLKPNESAGPLILHKKSFRDFIENRAEGWQKQAYLRSRRISEDHFYLKDQFDHLRLSEEDNLQVADILKKLLTKSQGDLIDIKNSAGGLVHTEFVVQRKILNGIHIPKTSSTQNMIELLEIEESTKKKLTSNYLFLRKFEQVFQICNDSSSTKVGVSSNNLSRVSKVLGQELVFEHLKQVIDDQQKLLNSLT